MTLRTDCGRLFAIFILLLLVSLAHVAAAASSPSLAKVFDDYRPPGGPKVVQIGLVVEEVTRIDQQAENFSVVATLQMHWQDPDLAFQPEPGDEPFRVYRGEAFDKYIDERHLRWPRFSIFNQQGKRYTQNMVVVQWPMVRCFTSSASP